jgi:glycoside/pentoside/hexuronide:cation symporter, GPH family
MHLVDKKSKLSIGVCLLYASGMVGWSILNSLISVILIYFYLPPKDVGLPALVTQVAILGVFNAISLITAGSRLVDAIYDPFIAQFSDASKHPKGRRIPIMKWAILPSLVFCTLIFFPLYKEESPANIAWLIFVLIAFYISTTTYIIPYSALLPQMAVGGAEKVKLASWQSFGYVVGIGIASNAFNLTAVLQEKLSIQKLEALQYTIVAMAILAGLFMLVTVLTIRESDYEKYEPSTVNLKSALITTLKNRNFRFFIVADFAYFISVTLITSGLMYFVTVLLPLDEEIGNTLMMTMVSVSFLFYPITNKASGKVGKKKLIFFSLLLLSVIFLGIFGLGKVNVAPTVQIYTLIALAAIPMASLNILPNAVLSEIIEKDGQETKQNKEAVYFAVRYFFVKLAQTLGIAFFSMFLLYGKDTGNDFGVRLNGLAGCILCALAAFTFLGFKEEKK